MTPVASTSITNSTVCPTTFKVVEFYRNNNLPSNIINNTTESSSYDLNKNSNGASTTLCRSNSISIANNIVYNTLGFNVIGGYLTEIPVTIVDVATSLNNSYGSKISKVITRFHAYLYLFILLIIQTIYS